MWSLCGTSRPKLNICRHSRTRSALLQNIQDTDIIPFNIVTETEVKHILRVYWAGFPYTVLTCFASYPPPRQQCLLPNSSQISPTRVTSPSIPPALSRRSRPKTPKRRILTFAPLPRLLRWGPGYRLTMATHLAARPVLAVQSRQRR